MILAFVLVYEPVSDTHLDVYKRQTIDPEVLLRDYSMVFQDVVLFDYTVMENIRLGKRGATDEEVRAAAKAANCDCLLYTSWGCMRIAKQLMDDKVPITRVKSNTECDVNYYSWGSEMCIRDRRGAYDVRQAEEPGQRPE